MASAQKVQSFLRFLTQEAKVPLAQAMAKVRELQEANLITPATLATCELSKLKSIFGDEKTVKQVFNAAKRVSKKRQSSDASLPAPSPKKAKSSYGEPLNAAEYEDSLALPDAELDEETFKDVVVYSNRAPLVLAFAVALLKFTMPEQPLSSRLSLAQAVVSANSKVKAVHVGLDSGKPAEEEGWGEGQPVVRVMNRDIRVMKRWGYTVHEKQDDEASTQGTLDAKPVAVEEPALWGVDLEALKKANDPTNAASNLRKSASATQLPIYTAQSARAYLLKSFETPKSNKPDTKKKSNAAIVAEKERNLGLLLRALELMYQSWAQVLSKEDLDKRAWGWYVRIRPEVASGAAGWGGKGNIKLSDILDLRRPEG